MNGRAGQADASFRIEHQLKQPHSLLGDADLPRAMLARAAWRHRSLCAWERGSCAARETSARPAIRAAAMHGQLARAVWSCGQTSAMLPRARVSDSRGRRGGRDTAVGDCLASRFDCSMAPVCDWWF
jgi:hypothetical protein